MNARAACCALALLAPAAFADDATPETAAPDRTAVPAMPAPKAAQDRLLDIGLLGERAVAVGQFGVVLISDDGKNWRQAESPVSAMLTRLRFTAEGTAWATGYDATLLRSTDGGEKWTLQHNDPSARALSDVLFLDAQHGIAVGAYGSHLETRDGGNTWAAVESPLSALGMHLNVLLKLSDGSLFVAGERGLMARSTDAGASWQILDSPYAGSWFGALPLGSNGMLVYGMRGNVFSTADLARCITTPAESWDPYARETTEEPARIAALGWRKHETPIRESLFGALTLNAQSVMLVGVNGTALKLDVGSGALTAVTTPAKETLSKLVVFKNHLLAVGRKGVQDLGEAP